jgi:hypothetical protein
MSKCELSTEDTNELRPTTARFRDSLALSRVQNGTTTPFWPIIGDSDSEIWRRRNADTLPSPEPPQIYLKYASRDLIGFVQL